MFDSNFSSFNTARIFFEKIKISFRNNDEKDFSLMFYFETLFKSFSTNLQKTNSKYVICIEPSATRIRESLIKKMLNLYLNQQKIHDSLMIKNQIYTFEFEIMVNNIPNSKL